MSVVIFRIIPLPCMNSLDFKLLYSAQNIKHIITLFRTIINSSQWLLFVSSFCSMSFILVDQEIVVETDNTVKNTGEDIMRETGENTIPLSNSNKRSMTLVDTEDNNTSEDCFPP